MTNHKINFITLAKNAQFDSLTIAVSKLFYSNQLSWKVTDIYLFTHSAELDSFKKKMFKVNKK